MSSGCVITRATLIALMGCSGGVVDGGSDHGHDVTLAVDLGRLSPNAWRRFFVDLEPLPAPVELLELASTCACVDVGLQSDGAAIVAGARLPAGSPLRLHGVYRPRQAGEFHDSVTAYFGARDGSRHRRCVRLRATGDWATSLTTRKELELLVALPESNEVSVVELARPLARRSLRIVGTPSVVVDVLRETASGEATTLGLRVAELMRTGVFEGHLELDLSQMLVERVPLRVRAYAPETLSPERVITRLPEGAYQEIPIVLRRPRPSSWSTDCVTWEYEPVVAGSGSTAVTQAIEISIVPTDEAGTGSEVKLKLCVRSRAGPGLYRGLALVRPHADARHALSLPYLVRVEPTERSSPTNSGSASR